MASGVETREEIEDAIRSLQAREREIRAELEEINGRRARLLERRIDGFRELARVRTKDALSDGVIDEADQLSSEVTSLLVAREKTVAALHQRQRVALDARTRQITDLDQLTREIAEREARLDEIAAEAQRDLAADPKHATLVAAAGELADKRERAAVKVEQAGRDRAEKGKHYEADPLFLYLWQRGYGSPDYAASKVVRWLDGKVAALIGYADARANYSVLIQIPDRLAAHVADLESQLGAANRAVETRLSTRISEIAGEDIVGRLDELRSQKGAAAGELTQIAAELTDIGAQINRYAEGLDEGLRNAIARTAEFLAEESLERLTRLARETPAPTDDQLVARIAGIDRDLAGLDASGEKLKQRLDETFERRQELVRIATEFRRNRYDEPGSIFSEETSGGDLLEELLKGIITGADYWARTQRRQSWGGRPADPFRRSSGLPPFDGSIFGGSRRSGGGGGRGSGGFGGRDFKTGGGF
ncbi:MAG: hypothetical protein GC150_03440 [Rhizobiales bacterium]|nr:hypothetical protein [Hyphomicrobiales bacterium]